MKATAVTAVLALGLLLLLLCGQPSSGLRIHRPWSTRHWCEVLENPHHPFAYAKLPTQTFETKGVVVDNTQHLGHECTTRGARTKCLICEDITCDSDMSRTCHYQIQGMNWNRLPKNIPTLNNMPWAVGPNVRHRNDFGAAERACVMLTGGDCILDTSTDFEHCSVRCVGAGTPGFSPTPYGWTTPTDRVIGNPQGNVTTLAGAGTAGYKDGPPGEALFNNPVGVVVDRQRNVYVADERNHRIRKVFPNGTTITIGGSGPTGDNGGGFLDGPAATSRFSSPSSVAIFYNWTAGATEEEALVVIVSDTNNHKIRLIHQGMVRTLAGGERGLADGWGMLARMDTPHGIAVRQDGYIYVADTLNFLIRKISPDGYVHTLAGTTIRSPFEVQGAGCPWPCLDGVPGSDDGPLRNATFHYPYDVEIGPNNTVIVADGDRIRRLSDNNVTTSIIQTVASQDRVVTLAGGMEPGERDGHGPEATFNAPRGISMSAEGRMYVADSVGCRIRRISSAHQTAVPITCARRLQDEVRPSGCTMYDMPTDAIDLKSTPMSNNIYYNYESYFLVGNGDEHREKGLKVEPCVGSPEPDIGVTSTHETLGPYHGTGYKVLDQKQDLNDNTTMDFMCPPGCGAAAAAEAAANGASPVVGDEYYADISLICAAAVHAGVIDDGTGGAFTLRMQRNWGPTAGADTIGHNRGLEGVTRNGVPSEPAPEGWIRTFTLAPYPVTYLEVQTIVGAPNAPLENNCDFLDTQPPQAAKLSRPTGVAVFVNASLTHDEYLYIADANNHRIRISTAVCSKLCENGGYCVSEEKCACPPGWLGDDCAQPYCAPGTCGSNQVCTAPGECTCKPGFGGPNCKQALCVQTCIHGQCVAPDTCLCDHGWFDPNCTTPVCSQTCGNGGNCTAPDFCTCPTLWQGPSCRDVVCEQPCNHGHCVAPHTCLCDEGWSGHDCSKPVCHQGYYRTDPVPWFSFSKERPIEWDMYTPCNITDWCDSTNEFDCKQLERKFTPKQVPALRSYNGHPVEPDECFMMELTTTADTSYRYEDELHNVTWYARRTPLTPYEWGPTRYYNPWSSPTNESVPDRQIALVQWQTVSQGVYVCANGGNCSAPDTCVCADGWIGFDCRIPVCKQGYHEPDIKHDRPDKFGQYIQEQPQSGAWERQGVYECSARPFTIWEHSTSVLGKFQDYVHDHPNYYSRYMDAEMGWDDIHYKMPDLNDDTQEGWRRDGWWEPTGTRWKKGLCWPRYNRTCPNDPDKQMDLRSNTTHLVDWTDQAFEPRIAYDIWKVTSRGRWFEEGGECIDYVQQGCYNNGTCVAPNTCVCAPGWEGDDCSIPICYQSVVDITDTWGINTTKLADGTDLQYRECPNRGNCTLPDICTCEKGWEGHNCTIPICAQECLNGGRCVLPDLCECVTWENSFRDGRDPPRPLFQQDNGEAQVTGWTGYDCSTPICVQAEAWIPNDGVGGHVLEVTTNAGESFQAGCPTKSQFIERDSPNRTRSSPELCNVVDWYQGVYELSWTNELDGELKSKDSQGRTVLINFPDYWRDEDGFWNKRETPTYGEGLYACFNLGSCIAPDTCHCADGWSGYDCNTPLCRHVNYFGVTVGCLNSGICADRDFCNCTMAPSILHEVELDAPEGPTGYNGSDCSMAICVQGWYDPECELVPPFQTGVASGGEGCYRCANGGNCTAPDFCTCTEEWQGYDCRTPVCTASVDAETLFHLNTVDPLKVLKYETDPCGMETQAMWNGALVGQGNCTQPNVCTCLCRERTWLDEDSEYVEIPWLDPLNRELPPGFGNGFSDCLDGFQGNLNSDGSYRSCHQQIYVPSVLERYSVTFIVFGVLLGVGGTLGYFSIRRRIAMRQQLLKEERRRSRRSSEDNGGVSAFD